MPQLKNFPQIRKLALDLGLKLTGNPVDDILRHCDRRVKKFLKEFPECNTLPNLLNVIAAKVGTIFETVKTDDDLQQIKQKYLSKREKIFVRLEEDLDGEVYGITFKRTNRQSWEPQFVSVIDCRGQKGLRAYYTKWHEIAHLLVLTDQLRLSFRRTQAHTAVYDPEEALMEVIAGKFGFYPPMISEHAKGDISFDVIDILRGQLCPEASMQASQINFVKSWPKPCLLVHGKLALKKQQKINPDQQDFIGASAPIPELRAVHVAYSDDARNMGITIFENMRIPKQSVIHRVFTNQIDYEKAKENLSWWETSGGKRLSDCPVNIQAKYFRDSVDALIIPL